MRKTLSSLGFAAVCLIGFVIVALLGARGAMHSYLAAWLALLAVPAGALPLVMGLELLPVGAVAVAPPLRRLLGLMPLTALLAVPILAATRLLYPDLGRSTAGFPGVWNDTTFFVIRAILILLVWVGLALLFSRPAARPRPLLAGLGLVLHLVVVTLVARDWILAVEPDFTSSASGVLLLAAQIGMALAAAAGLAARDGAVIAPRRFSKPLAVALVAWLFLTFTQYLVVWSANLPAEAAWYRHRSADAGTTAVITAAIVCVVALVALLSHATARRPWFFASVAALLVLLHAGEMLWLVTPAIRGHFSIRFTDLLAIAGLASLSLGFGRVFGPRTATGELRRG